jgi:multicomponent Na+:H+ antiporter subunit E
MSFVLTASIMFAFWILISGEFSFILILSGVFSSLLVAYMSHDLLTGKGDIKLGLTRTIRFIRYLPWLLWQIVLANLDLVYRTLHPKMPISPRIINFKNNFKTDLGMVTLANSITLTPGTVTIDVNENEFIVHAIAEETAQSLISGEMQARVKKIEGEYNV